MHTPNLSHPFIGPALETEHFRHVEFKLPEFCRMARMGQNPIYTAAGRDYFDDRWHFIKSYLRANPQIPQAVRDEAERYSRELVFSFTNFRSRIVRHAGHGALDSSKLARLATPGLSARAFERLAANAYRHRDHVQSTTMRPRIAIVGDMNNIIRTRNPDYMRVLGRLAYVIGEAAKLSGVEVALYGSRGFPRSYANRADPTALKMARVLGMHDASKRPHIVATLKDWDDDVTGAEYAIFTDTVPHAPCVFPVPLFQAIHMLTGGTTGMNSHSGDGGIEFARSQGANIVIAFGSFDASEHADLQFPAKSRVEDVVAGIVAHFGSMAA